MRLILMAIMSLFLSAYSGGYKYIGVAGDIIVLSKDEKSIFVRINDSIPNTNIRMISVNKYGAVTSAGLIPLVPKTVDVNRLAEEELERRDSLLQTLLDSVKFRQGVCLVDAQRGRCNIVSVSLDRRDESEVNYQIECLNGVVYKLYELRASYYDKLSLKDCNERSSKK